MQNIFEYIEKKGVNLKQKGAAILINDNSEINRKIIYNVVQYFKQTTIVTNNIRRFFKIEKELEENGMPINISNNKKKCLRKKEIIINNVVYRENDKVIQLSNMPDENIFNGDIGYIETIKNGSKKEIYINFDGNIVRYTPANFQKFKHAYAISIHKSQGSEFDTVIIPLVNNYGKMLYRKLIYTAVTRVKKKLYLIGEIEALEKAIQNNESNIRRTTLKKFIIDNIKNV